MAPRATHTFGDVVASIVGIVMGAGTFKTPAIVAAKAGSELTLLIAWLLGGAVSLAGALCYAELATAYPNAGGEFHYLSRAWGRHIAFLFAWARMSVIQTGSIAIQAFLFGDYAAQIIPIGRNGPVVYALLSVIILTALHSVSIQRAKQAQSVLTLFTVIGLILVLYAGFSAPAQSVVSPDQPLSSTEPNSFGIAMVFVLLTYGGWNEAVYISAELHNPERDMRRALLWSLTLITGIFLLTNLASLFDALADRGVSQSDKDQDQWTFKVVKSMNDACAFPLAGPQVVRRRSAKPETAVQICSRAPISGSSVRSTPVGRYHG